MPDNEYSTENGSSSPNRRCSNCGYPGADGGRCPLCNSIGHWYHFEILFSILTPLLAAIVLAGIVYYPRFVDSLVGATVDNTSRTIAGLITGTTPTVTPTPAVTPSATPMPNATATATIATTYVQPQTPTAVATPTDETAPKLITTPRAGQSLTDIQRNYLKMSPSEQIEYQNSLIGTRIYGRSNVSGITGNYVGMVAGESDYRWWVYVDYRDEVEVETLSTLEAGEVVEFEATIAQFEQFLRVIVRVNNVQIKP